MKYLGTQTDDKDYITKKYVDDGLTAKQASISASGILKGDGSGGVSAATAGTDYQAAVEVVRLI